jgi:hypothetical protein
MKRIPIAVAVLALTATTSQAGPIRDRLAAVFHRPACQSCQTQPTVTYAPQYQPGPVQQAVGGVIYTAGTAVQQAGGVVSSYPVGGWVVRPTVCSNGTCR